MNYDNNQKSYIYVIGLYLSIAYVFFDLIGNGVILPKTVNKIALYCLLGYGAFAILIRLYHGQFIIPDYSLYYLIVVFLCVFSNLYSPGNEFMPKNLYTMIICFFLTLIMHSFIRTKKEFAVFCWGNIFTSIVMFFLLLISGKLYGSRLIRLGDDLKGNANVFAMGMMYPCMCAIWMLIYGQYKKKIQLLLLFTIIIDMYAITLSAGRKSFVLPFVFFYLLLFYKQGEQNKKHIIKYTILTVIIVLLTIQLMRNIPILYETIGLRIEQMLNGITGEGIVDGSSQVRSLFRKTAIEGWLESPIWGHGFDSFKYYARDKIGYFVYSHCNQTEILFSGGIILFIAYYGAYVYIYYKANHSCIPNEYAAFVKAAVISEFIFDFGLVSYNMTYVQRFMILAFIAVGFTTEESNNKLNQKQISKYIIGG